MKTRPKRKDSFFGMHFDFHAGREQTGIGAQLDRDTLEELMSRVKPEYVQCDTKGHAGNSSYPTKVGYPSYVAGSDGTPWRGALCPPQWRVG